MRVTVRIGGRPAGVVDSSMSRLMGAECQTLMLEMEGESLLGGRPLVAILRC